MYYDKYIKYKNKYVNIKLNNVSNDMHGGAAINDTKYVKDTTSGDVLKYTIKTYSNLKEFEKKNIELYMVNQIVMNNQIITLHQQQLFEISDIQQDIFKDIDAELLHTYISTHAYEVSRLHEFSKDYFNKWRRIIDNKSLQTQIIIVYKNCNDILSVSFETHTKKHKNSFISQPLISLKYRLLPGKYANLIFRTNIYAASILKTNSIVVDLPTDTTHICAYDKYIQHYGVIDIGTHNIRLIKIYGDLDTVLPRFNEFSQYDIYQIDNTRYNVDQILATGAI
jgi:hypothetical protein